MKIYPKIFNTDCPICLEKNNYKKSIILSCNHVFHKKCIHKWMDKTDNYEMYSKYDNIHLTGSCPNCRTNINTIIYGKKQKFSPFACFLRTILM